jgi:hypothetical protein
VVGVAIYVRTNDRVLKRTWEVKIINELKSNLGYKK